MPFKPLVSSTLIQRLNTSPTHLGTDFMGTQTQALMVLIDDLHGYADALSAHSRMLAAQSAFLAEQSGILRERASALRAARRSTAYLARHEVHPRTLLTLAPLNICLPGVLPAAS